MEIKKWLMLVGVVVVCVFGVLQVKTIIKNEVFKETQKIQENFIKEKAEIKIEYEKENLEKENSLKKRIVDLETKLEESKVLMEKIQKENRYKALIKKDVSAFMKEIDSLLGIKGKPKNEK